MKFYKIVESQSKISSSNNIVIKASDILQSLMGQVLSIYLIYHSQPWQIRTACAGYLINFTHSLF